MTFRGVTIMRALIQGKGLRFVSFCMFIILLSGSAFAADINWIGGTGNWNEIGNWAGGMPGSSDDVLIDDGNLATSFVNLNTNASIGTLTLDTGDTLNINNSESLTVSGGSIVNNGEILINSTGSNTYLYISGETTLAGNGAVTMGPNDSYSNFRAVSAVDSNLLINTSSHTIQGAGQFGSNYFSLDNQGTVTANVDGSTLSMDLREGAATRSNSGIFQAENGGTLNIHSSGIIDNTGGAIEALDTSNVIIGSNTTIQGGTLQTSDSGVIGLENNGTLAPLQTLPTPARSGWPTAGVAFWPAPSPTTARYWSTPLPA